tara:strand:- start:3307 stop:4032 length:726 start_codon:yes stop_codon:yes gene_type:complete
LKYLLHKFLPLNDRSLNYGEKIIRSWLKKIDSNNVLDVGAGQGRDLEIVKSLNKDANLEAIENFEPSIDLLEKKGINVSKINIENDLFPYSAESFDLIIANQILEHCKEIFWIHHEIFRTLKVGGYLIVGVPNLAAYYNRINLTLTGKQPYCIALDGAHVRGFTNNGYRSLFKNVLKTKIFIESFKGANFVPFPNQMAIHLAKLFPNLSTCIFFLIQKKEQYDGEFLKACKGLETPFWLGN